MLDALAVVWLIGMVLFTGLFFTGIFNEVCSTNKHRDGAPWPWGVLVFVLTVLGAVSQLGLIGV